MNAFIGTVIGIIIGGIVTILVSRYFYKKSQKSKELSCYVQYISEILTNIDPDVKNNLEIEFKEHKVEKLYQAQIIIANTGDISIKSIIKPLKLNIPAEGEILDANIVYFEPKGRQDSLNLTVDSSSITFDFPLLNSAEYFIVKVLVKGNPPKPEIEEKENEERGYRLYEYESKQYKLFKFTITAEDLPPEITSSPLPSNYSRYEPDGFDFSTLWGTAIFGFLGFSVAFILYNIGLIQEDLFIFNFRDFFTGFSFLKFSIIIGWLISGGLAFIAMAIPASMLSDFKSPKPKFELPQKYKYSRPF